ncbi:MAG TPA: universal stress protein [Solirubrobacteraceae bacterium]|nr:universal stress protein [Solirubrobacteraceae bacterium]
MFQRILLAWDGSAVALRAFDVAIDLSRRYDVELVSMSIAYTPAQAETAAGREESTEAARRYLAQTFDEVRDRAERAGVAVEHVIVAGDEPQHVLVEYCHERGFDLIVTGHHHEARAGRLLLQGVAPKLIAAASVPVLVVGEHER